MGENRENILFGTIFICFAFLGAIALALYLTKEPWVLLTLLAPLALFGLMTRDLLQYSIATCPKCDNTFSLVAENADEDPADEDPDIEKQ